MEKYTQKDVDRAMEIMDDGHYGQMRMDGGRYREHPVRVMQSLEIRGYSRATLITALLHDVAEDCPSWPLERIRKEGGFGDDVMHPLELMTKQKGQDGNYYENLYIPRIATHPRSRAVKRYDLVDNMDLTSIETPSLKQIVNIEKYGRALVYLSRFPQPRV